MVRRRDHGVRSDGPHGRRLVAGALVPAIQQAAWWLDAVGGSVCGGVTAHQARFRDLRAVPGTRGGVSGRRCMGGPFLVFWARDRAGVQQGDGANVPALCLIAPTAGHVTHGTAAAPPVVTAVGDRPGSHTGHPFMSDRRRRRNGATGQRSGRASIAQGTPVAVIALRLHDDRFVSLRTCLPCPLQRWRTTCPVPRRPFRQTRRGQPLRHDFPWRNGSRSLFA